MNTVQSFIAVIFDRRQGDFNRSSIVASSGLEARGLVFESPELWVMKFSGHLCLSFFILSSPADVLSSPIFILSSPSVILSMTKPEWTPTEDEQTYQFTMEFRKWYRQVSVFGSLVFGCFYLFRVFVANSALGSSFPSPGSGQAATMKMKGNVDSTESLLKTKEERTNTSPTAFFSKQLNTVQ